MRAELVARWLRSQVDAAPETAWWKILTRLVASLDPSARSFQAPHGVDELLDLAIARLPDIAAKARSRFGSAVIAALARLDAESPYAVLFHVDNGHLRARTTSNLLIDAAVRVIAIAESRGEGIDLAALSDRSRETLARASVATAITMAQPDLGSAIAGRAFDAVIARMTGEDWPDATDLETLREVLPLVGPAAPARLAAALGEPPSVDGLGADLDSASEVRADWFRTAQWAAHLPEAARPASWTEALLTA